MSRRRAPLLTAPAYFVSTPELLTETGPPSTSGLDIKTEPSAPAALGAEGPQWRPQRQGLPPLPKDINPQSAGNARPDSLTLATQQPEHAQQQALQTRSLPPSQPTVQGLLERQPINVSWVALCPHIHQHSCRLFMSELTAWYQTQHCGAHLPAPACTHIRRVGGIATLPPDAQPPPAAPAVATAAQPSATPPSGAGTSPALPPQPAEVAGGAQGPGDAAGAGVWGGGTGGEAGASVRAGSVGGAAGSGAGAGAKGLRVMHPVFAVVVNQAGPQDQAVPSEPLQGLVHHAWSHNYRATLTGLRHSLSTEQQTASAATLSSDCPCATVVYLVSPTDDPQTATSVLAEAALHLAPLLTNTYTNTTNTQQPHTQDTAKDQGAAPMVIDGNDNTQHEDSAAADSAGGPPANNIVLQVLLPSLLKTNDTRLIREAALAVYNTVRDGVCH